MSDIVASFKDVMRNYPSGVTVITTYDEEKDVPVGLTATSFTAVSIDPLLILFCIDKRSSSLPSFEKATRFGINILSEEQEDVCFHFAKSMENKFENQKWSRSTLKIPIIDNSTAILECEKEKDIVLGDHTVFIGKVINIKNYNKKPLIYFNRQVHVI